MSFVFPSKQISSTTFIQARPDMVHSTYLPLYKIQIRPRETELLTLWLPYSFSHLGKHL